MFTLARPLTIVCAAGFVLLGALVVGFVMTPLRLTNEIDEFGTPVVENPTEAQLSDIDQAEFIKVLDNSLSLGDMVRRVRDGEFSDDTVRAITEILRNTQEGEIHRMRDGKNYKVYVHRDGHQEAVYDGKGALVQDGINDGSYNFFHPERDPLRHFSFDIAMWLLLGQSPNDPTTRDERVRAYSADVYTGIANAMKAPRTDGRVDVVNIDEPGCAEAIAIVLLAIERGNADKMIRVISTKEEVSEQELVSVVKQFERGLQSLFMRDDEANK